MSTLAPDLFQRRFPDLMELGRARLPSLAPDWTDHNAHDPGITLMELLAWTAEAQLFSVSRTRRDERSAYAALLGVAPVGTRPARGAIWRDPLDPSSPAATFARSDVIRPDAVIGVAGTETPTFRPTDTLLWAAGRIVRLETRHASGDVTDHTAVNERGGPPFLPFGESAGPGAVLRMAFECRDAAGLFGRRREDSKGARWAIGVRAATPSGVAPAPAADAAPPRHSPLEATLFFDQKRVRLPIVSDSTDGLLATGVLLLDLDAVQGSPIEFTLELRAPAGSTRPPRLLRIEPNVIPIEQGRRITDELHVANGRPDWSFTLDVPGLRFGAGQPPVTLKVSDRGGFTSYRVCDRLSDSGPEDEVYEFDARNGRVTFGNGVNGRMPPAESQVLVSYSVSDGDQGAVARNRKWTVAGFGGAFGTNPDPIAGGTAAAGFVEERRDARRRAWAEHALVTPDDVVRAARALPHLEVARAWVPTPHPAAPRTGTVTLVALRSRPGDVEPARIPETARWLAAIQRRLAPRMPLGTRLLVTAPRYVPIFIRATVLADAGRDPDKVKAEVVKALEARLRVVATPAGDPPRRPGIPLTPRDVVAWIRGVEGVDRVVEFHLVRADTGKEGEVAVPPGGLPRLDRARMVIEVTRPERGGAA